MREREHFLCERTGTMDTSLIFWVSDFCDCSFALAGPNNHWSQPKSEELHLHWPLYVKMDRGNPDVIHWFGLHSQRHLGSGSKYGTFRFLNRLEVAEVSNNFSHYCHCVVNSVK